MNDNKFYYATDIANAIQRKEAFFTIPSMVNSVQMEYHFLELPTPQTCGTMGQQRSYAVDKAMSILNKFYAS